MNPYVQLLILLGAVMLTGFGVIRSKERNPKAQKLILAFSGAFILALSVFHLLPEVYHHAGHAETAGLLILAGFLLQIILDYFSGGVEHGHVHLPENTSGHHHHGEHHHHGHEIIHPGMSRFPYIMMSGLCIHAFIEGLPLFTTSSGTGLFTGILLHNIPIAFTLVNVFLAAGRSSRQALFALLIFGLMTPLGAMVSLILPFDTEHFGHLALALVIGVFFHLSTTILFESDQNHRFNLLKFITILAGAACAFLLS
jgi:zinc and cadmium transporter